MREAPSRARSDPSLVAAADRRERAGVEWDNGSAGFENAPDWGSGHNGAVRQGAAWIAVATQAVGVQGGQTIIGQTAPGGLRASDPDRYGSLVHPGDNYSYDIFSQA